VCNITTYEEIKNAAGAKHILITSEIRKECINIERVCDRSSSQAKRSERSERKDVRRFQSGRKNFLQYVEEIFVFFGNKRHTLRGEKHKTSNPMHHQSKIKGSPRVRRDVKERRRGEGVTNRREERGIVVTSKSRAERCQERRGCWTDV